MSSLIEYSIKTEGFNMGYKHDYDKALARFRIILQRLNEGEALSVTELAEEFNVSTRTIQRDFNNRLILSYPIEKVGRKWKMQEGFKIEKSSDIEDMLVLDIIENMSQSVGKVFGAKAKKLLSKIKNQDHNPIYAKLDLEDISSKLKEIQLLESAIKKKSIILANYTMKNTFNVKLKPLKIVNYEGFWYLIALDTKNNDKLKRYYIKNISSINITNKTFESDTKLDDLLDKSISIWFSKDTKPFDVKLYISKEIAKYFQRKPISKTQTIESINSDGSIEINVKITHEMEIQAIVNYWLPNIKILEPEWLDQKYKSMIDWYCKEYYSN